MTGIAIEQLVKSYDGIVPAIDGIDLEVGDGELVVLLGPSGCGKTTTLRCIAGFEDVTGGRILMDGSVVSDANFSLPPEKRAIGMVFQSYAVWPHMSVFENVAYGVRLKKGITRTDADRRASQALETVGLGELQKRGANELSGGQQQRVALARAIALEPRALLFDEPLSNLDAKLRQRMRLEIRALQRRLGIKSVYVTHDQEEAMVVADRIVLMKDGRIEQIGAPQEIYDRPNSVFCAEFIGSANVIRGAVESHTGKGTRIFLAPGLIIPAPAIDVPVSTKVDVIIRPEHFSVNDIQNQAREDATHLHGTVTESVFVGAFTEITVDVGSVKVRAHVIPARSVKVGSAIELTLNVDRMVILRANSNPTLEISRQMGNKLGQS